MIPFWDDHEGDHSLRMKDMSEVRMFGKWSMELAWSSLKYGAERRQSPGEQPGLIMSTHRIYIYVTTPNP